MENGESREEQAGKGSNPLGSVDSAADYRKLGQPADTISGTTRELFEVRSSGSKGSSDDASSTVFKIIAITAIVAVVLGIIASSIGLFGGG